MAHQAGYFSAPVCDGCRGGKVQKVGMQQEAPHFLYYCVKNLASLDVPKVLSLFQFFTRCFLLKSHLLCESKPFLSGVLKEPFKLQRGLPGFTVQTVSIIATPT